MLQRDSRSAASSRHKVVMPQRRRRGRSSQIFKLKLRPTVLVSLSDQVSLTSSILDALVRCLSEVLKVVSAASST